MNSRDTTTILSEEPPIGSGVTGPLRAGAAIAGICLVIIGAIFAVRLFTGIVEAIRNPDEAHQVLDRWENLVRGRIPDLIGPRETADTPQGTEPAPESGSISEARSWVTPFDLAEYVAVMSRPVAILVLLILLSMAVGLSLRLIITGGTLNAQMDGLAALKQVVNELRNRR